MKYANLSECKVQSVVRAKIKKKKKIIKIQRIISLVFFGSS